MKIELFNKKKLIVKRIYDVDFILFTVTQFIIKVANKDGHTQTNYLKDEWEFVTIDE